MIFLKGNGIVISKKEIEEADRIITIFMEDFGKISTVVKGIRKSKKRDKTAVDLLALTNFTFYKKGETVILSEFNNIESYENIKNDINKLNIVFYFFYILNQILVENGRSRKLYTLLEKTLASLNKSEDERKDMLMVVYFLYEVIKDEGILPENNEFLSLFEDSKKKIQFQQLQKEKEYRILEELFKNNLRKIIEDEQYKIENIKKTILVLENYLNNNLEIRLDAKKFLWGELLW